MSHAQYDSYEILRIDPYLQPHSRDIELRMQNYSDTKQKILGDAKTLSDYANGHMFFGFHKTPEGWYYREWAPNASGLALFGDFNNWNPISHKLTRKDNGVWEIFIPGADTLKHGSHIKVKVGANNTLFDRVPLYCKRVVQDEQHLHFDGQVWDAEYTWQSSSFTRDPNEPLFIYEAHVGMAGEEERVHTYAEFTATVLPRIKALGYNTIQLMAVMEHPYYGSFGYQVSNFYAVCSRFGTPEELKALIDTAHQMGIAVLLDIVHSHAAPNTVEGIAEFDGTDYQFFHRGARGNHPAWKTKLFDYGKPEVIHFLLSNVKFWLEEYHFDGFRFDGVTSMLYHDHGLGASFTSYDKYFSLNTDTEAITYLQLAAELAKEVNPNCILIAEDMSGMPGMCLPIRDGGIGFDYRLGMGLPDYWIKIIKKQKDEEWQMGQMWHELASHRPREKTIAYCESHDQALVGDKTIIFRLADKEMYWNMSKEGENLVIDRAIALHKIIRLITCAGGGNGYLTFMGNEFGHPEWIDFPREGNGWSYAKATRKWNLCDADYLRYHFLRDFDVAMIDLVKREKLLLDPANLMYCHEQGKILAFARGFYLFIFNFHPNDSHEVSIHINRPIISAELSLNSNWIEFGGYAAHDDTQAELRSVEDVVYLKTTIHRRTALVYRLD